MVLLELATYFFGATVSLVIAVFLLGVNIEFGKGQAFSKVKRYMAICALIDLCLYSCDIMCMYYGVNYLLLDTFLVPVTFYLQLYLLSFAFFGLLHSPLRMKRYQIILPAPVIILTIAYLWTYYLRFDGVWTEANYTVFLSTSAARLVTAILYIVIVAEVIVILVTTFLQVVRYRKLIGNYFSGQMESSGVNQTLIAYAFIAYIVMASLDFIISSAVADIIFMWVNTILYMAFAIVVLNMQAMYSKVSPAFAQSLPDDTSYKTDLTAAEAKIPGKVRMQTPEEGGNNSASRRYVEDIVNVWSQRSDRPFLKDGITLGDAAAQMGISPRFLSGYINDIYEVNFNTWINMLRVGYVKEELSRGTSDSMTSIAMKAGFSDLSAMSRIFKRLEGETPSQFRQKLKMA